MTRSKPPATESGKLNAFIQHVDNAEAQGEITPEEAAALRQDALDILDSLGC